ncbi:hypothetical protein DdX_15508 [Ditylenchus destructor]|uniref:Secreted protein n=1 Tax=Ditylenchus destructor TaxID=166010 RepID=A0AAD4MS51_9BILA|nr:hypothetical protein DdX_15508 [Ditylenchus destructor]
MKQLFEIAFCAITCLLMTINVNAICELVAGACSASVSVSGDCVIVSGYSESPIDTGGSVTVCANGFPAVISNDFNGCVSLLNGRFCGQMTLSAQILPPLALCVTANGAADGEGQAIDQCMAVPMSMSK